MSVSDDALVDDDRFGRVMKVSPTTSPKGLGQSIYREWLNTGEFLPVRAIGYEAVGQATKGLASATTLVSSRGRMLAVTIGFDTIEGDDGSSVSAMVFYPFLR